MLLLDLKKMIDAVKIDKNINKYVPSYAKAASDYDMNNTKKLRYAYIIFDEEEKRFNRIYVQSVSIHSKKPVYLFKTNSMA